MSVDEIKKIIENIFDERILSAITKMTNIQNDLSDRRDKVLAESGKEDDPRMHILQNEIDNLEISIMVLKSLKRI